MQGEKLLPFVASGGRLLLHHGVVDRRRGGPEEQRTGQWSAHVESLSMPRTQGDIMDNVKSGMLILLDEAKGNHREAFLLALDSMGHDARSKQHKHYNAVIKLMMVEWADELDEPRMYG